MKKMIALLLAMVMVLSLFAGCGKKNDVEETVPVVTDPVVEETEPVVDEPAVEEPTEEQPTAESGALDVLQKIWDATDDSEKFPTMGGDFNNLVDGAPGVYGLEDVESLTAQLLVPAEQAANIDEAASLFHGMMLNNFTCGVFHVTGDVQAFADAMYDAIKNNQWMCGFPETMIIAVIDGEYVLSAFGLNDIMTPFEANMKEAHENVDVLYTEAVA